MAEIIDGKKIADKILSGLADRISRLNSAGASPRLIVILVGQDPASLSYIKVKQKRAEEIGLTVEVKTYPENAEQTLLVREIEELNNAPDLSGILVQLPLPPHLNKQAVLDAVSPELDVDSLTSVNKSRLLAGKDALFVPPAAAAVMKILEHFNIDLKNARILLIGTGDLVGKPLAALFRGKGINYQLANRQTKNLVELSRQADVIITGVGKPGLVRGDMIKPGAVVIDAGTTGSESGELLGDIESGSVSRTARLLAPVPGGVGPVTVAMLLSNVVQNAEQRNPDI